MKLLQLLILTGVFITGCHSVSDKIPGKVKPDNRTYYIGTTKHAMEKLYISPRTLELPATTFMGEDRPVYNSNF